MYCTNCGNKIPDGARFCPTCGTAAGGGGNGGGRKGPKWWVVALIALAVLALLGGAFLLFVRPLPDPPPSALSSKTVTIAGVDWSAEELEELADEAGLSIREFIREAESQAAAEEAEADAWTRWNRQVSNGNYDVAGEGMAADLSACEDIARAEYNPETRTVEYEFACGGRGVIELEPEAEDEMSGAGLPAAAPGLPFRSTEPETARSIGLPVLPARSSRSGGTGKPSVLEFYSFGRNEEFAADHDKYLMANAQDIDFTIDRDVTVSDLLNLGGFDYVIIGAHGSRTFFGQTYYMSLPESYTKENSTAYRPYIDKDEILVRRNGNGRHYGVTADFFRNELANNLYGTVVFTLSCGSFGWDTVSDELNYELAEAFLSHGAKAVVGFRNSVKDPYAFHLTGLILANNGLYGYSVYDAFQSAIDVCTGNDVKYRQPDEMNAIAYPVLLESKEDGSYMGPLEPPVHTPDPTAAPAPEPESETWGEPGWDVETVYRYDGETTYKNIDDSYATAFCNYDVPGFTLALPQLEEANREIMATYEDFVRNSSTEDYGYPASFTWRTGRCGELFSLEVHACYQSSGYWTEDSYYCYTFDMTTGERLSGPEILARFGKTWDEAGLRLSEASAALAEEFFRQSNFPEDWGSQAAFDEALEEARMNTIRSNDPAILGRDELFVDDSGRIYVTMWIDNGSARGVEGRFPLY